ncbi:hypothetical protein HYX19_04125, partial [Candidatus Woesearchaeota archaeon]|nr:hypothetical protein [Candidatus Woesearchaeota archaeon]
MNKKVLMLGLAGLIGLGASGYVIKTSDKGLFNMTSKVELIDKNKLLESRAKFYYESLTQKRFGDMYDMFTPPNKRDIQREKHIKDFSSAFDGLSIKYDEPKVIKIEEFTAITQNTLNLTEREGKSLTICTRMLWVYHKYDNWYFESATTT